MAELGGEGYWCWAEVAGRGSGRQPTVTLCARSCTACAVGGLCGPCHGPEPVMTLPRTMADVLSEHVVFEVESIDRMYLNVYQPRLQYGGGASAFFVAHRGHKYASSVLMAPITEAFVANIHHFIAARGLDLVSFGKGEDKDAIAHRYLAAFPGKDGVVFVGRAQEKAWVFRTQKRRNPVTGAEYLWLTRATLQVNYFYFYCVDEDSGPRRDCNFNGVTPDKQGGTSDRRDEQCEPGHDTAVGGR